MLTTLRTANDEIAYSVSFSIALDELDQLRGELDLAIQLGNSEATASLIDAIGKAAARIDAMQPPPAPTLEYAYQPETTA